HSGSEATGLSGTAPAPVLPPERREDQQKGDKPQQIEPTALFGGHAAERQERLGRAEQQEAAAEGEEQALARAPPELQEEQSRDREAQGDGAAEKIIDHLRCPRPR